MTNYSKAVRGAAASLLFAFAPGVVWAAFDSGSTGADGAFAPTENIELQIPPSGIFNFTSVNVPAGVTVKFRKNANNTPVTILVSGDVTIAGTVDVSGSSSQNVGTSPLLDYTLPGVGGPGGFDGGRGGMGEVKTRAGNGLGPGGGGGGSYIWCYGTSTIQGGGGGGYAGSGGVNSFTSNWGSSSCNTGTGGPAYGSKLLVPLLGGSGGGGGAGGTYHQGSGGGGGGGAILIASSGTVNVTGAILAKGGSAGNNTVIPSQGGGSCGGGGSGGAIRIVASVITGGGTLSANGGATGNGYTWTQVGGGGSSGRVSTEVATTGTINVTGFPTLTIASVAGIAAPAAPTGNGDIVLPGATPNPVTVILSTTGVPITNTIKLTVTPQRGGAAVSVVSPPLTGTTASATTSVNIDIPAGTSTLFATTSYTLVASMGDELSRFARGERVERVELTAALNGASTTTLITVSGKRYTIPGGIPVTPARPG